MPPVKIIVFKYLKSVTWIFEKKIEISEPSAH